METKKIKLLSTLRTKAKIIPNKNGAKILITSPKKDKILLKLTKANIIRAI